MMKSSGVEEEDDQICCGCYLAAAGKKLNGDDDGDSVDNDEKPFAKGKGEKTKELLLQ